MMNIKESGTTSGDKGGGLEIQDRQEKKLQLVCLDCGEAIKKVNRSAYGSGAMT